MAHEHMCLDKGQRGAHVIKGARAQRPAHTVQGYANNRQPHPLTQVVLLALVRRHPAPARQLQVLRQGLRGLDEGQTAQAIDYATELLYELALSPADEASSNSGFETIIGDCDNANNEDSALAFWYTTCT